jgi:hypothetical protein
MLMLLKSFIQLVQALTTIMLIRYRIHNGIEIDGSGIMPDRKALKIKP